MTLRKGMHGPKRRTMRVWLVDTLKELEANPTDECVLWPFKPNVRGYGQLTMSDKISRTAHRAALVLASGEDPPGLDACHLRVCGGSKLCVNPAHLRWATRQDNLRDNVRHGVCPRHSVIPGESHIAAKHDNDSVRWIRYLLSQGVSTVWIDRAYGISGSYAIKNGITWKTHAAGFIGPLIDRSW